MDKFKLKDGERVNKVLVIVAHPDDEILGCGATMNRLADEGADVYTLILGEGITSRDEVRDVNLRKAELMALKQQVQQANNIIGVKETFLFDLPDNRFDSLALLDIIKIVEKIAHKINPKIIFTHHKSDLNIDHRITFNAVLTACRPTEGSVKEIYSFETPSSTEWNYPSDFSPNLFIDISGNIGKKLQALKIYKQELKRYPHPRSLESIKDRSKYWGSVCGLFNAEAFEIVKIIR